MGNPFEPYLTQGKQGDYRISHLFKPEFSITSEPYSLKVSTIHQEYKLFTLDDIIGFNDKINGAQSRFQGIIGERILFAYLNELIIKVRKNSEDRGAVGNVLTEKKVHEGKGFIANYNNNYLLRHKGKTNFVILQKQDTPHPDAFYAQEKSGLLASEIDGMAYYHNGDGNYLIFGEAKTSETWSNIGTKIGYSIANNIAMPLQTLFPDHKLIFMFLGHENLIHENERLNEHSSNLVAELEHLGVDSILAPLPTLPKEIKDYASDMADLVPLVRMIREKLV